LSLGYFLETATMLGGGASTNRPLGRGLDELIGKLRAREQRLCVEFDSLGED
jgi:hypothetical protein